MPIFDYLLVNLPCDLIIFMDWIDPNKLNTRFLQAFHIYFSLGQSLATR